jgi:hypothetical protein
MVSFHFIPFSSFPYWLFLRLVIDLAHGGFAKFRRHSAYFLRTFLALSHLQTRGAAAKGFEARKAKCTFVVLLSLSAFLSFFLSFFWVGLWLSALTFRWKPSLDLSTITYNTDRLSRRILTSFHLTSSNRFAWILIFIFIIYYYYYYFLADGYVANSVVCLAERFNLLGREQNNPKRQSALV